MTARARTYGLVALLILAVAALALSAPAVPAHGLGRDILVAAHASHVATLSTPEGARWVVASVVAAVVLAAALGVRSLALHTFAARHAAPRVAFLDRLRI